MIKPSSHQRVGNIFCLLSSDHFLTPEDFFNFLTFPPVTDAHQDILGQVGESVCSFPPEKSILQTSQSEAPGDPRQCGHCPASGNSLQEELREALNTTPHTAKGSSEDPFSTDKPLQRQPQH